ncbi:MAG: DNA repair protein RecN [Lachnospiraceae bacterium]|jgi:DNA repair protein RecN (Recombination protein N)|nr:DNA repair protein RecN [Lachnospiraceae bacterium]
MLLTIHVKNFALIDEAELSLGEGVQILTGETGAGKSILIDAVTAALGGKVPKGIVRKGADSALVELVFDVWEEDKRAVLSEMDIPFDEENQLIVSRRITEGRSSCKLNGVTVTQAMVRRATGLLIDIHGQHEHQSLLYKAKHLEILDDYMRGEAGGLKEKLRQAYGLYGALKKEADTYTLDAESRRRETDFIRYEIQEIENAGLKPGEEEELAARYRRMANSRKIVEGMNRVYQMIDGDAEDSLGDRAGMAAREMSQIAEYDETLADMQDQLSHIDDLLNDLGRQLADYIEDMSFDPGELKEVEERLDFVRGLQAKYGGSYEKIMEYLEEKRQRLDVLMEYDERREQVSREYEKAREQVAALCEELSELRQSRAEKLVEAVRAALVDLNFLDVKVELAFERLSEYHANGFDEVEFMISTNPGEACRPLGQVASGGELSRIMLAIKSVLADTDEIPTLIFDEIDTGISGRTAQKVAEKLSAIGRSRQVLCITHLAQIAAMADRHFLIEKQVVQGKTSTGVHLLCEEESVGELARLVGGAELTETGYRHARQMKELAVQIKRGGV